MTNTAPVNVVQMTDYQKSRRLLGQGEVANVLDGCRDLTVTRLNRTMAAMFEKLEDELFELAGHSKVMDEQNALMNARKQARIKRTAMEAAFKKQFVALFGERLNRKSDQKPAQDPLSSLSLELALVGDDEMEESIALSSMANALQEKCDAELQALSARLGFLLDMPSIDHKSNPLGPELILEAFQHAIKQLESGFKVRMAVTSLFDRHLTSDLPGIYKEVNARLISRQILPELRPGYRAKPRPGTASRPAGTSRSEAAPENAQEIFAMLQQLLMKSSQQLGPAGPAGASFAYGGGEAAVPAPGGFFDSLNRLQRGDNGMMAALGNALDAQAVMAGTGNFLHHLKATPFAAGLPHFDSITIDIVAMLFDYIFEDPKIPDPMKALIGRLQIPVLKVAMLDKRFFSSRAHPTRRLLDTIAAASIGRGQDMSQSDPLYRETDRIVQRIVLQFESDVAIFVELLAELETFLANEEQRDERTVEKSARIIHDRERLEIARVIAEDEIRQRVEVAPTITTVREFLLDSWVHVLTSAHAAEGEDGLSWKNAIRAMDELLWSVKPKLSAEERKHLVTLLPGLLKRLHAGMAAISLDEETQKSFFSQLVTCHTRAVKAGLGGETVPVPESNPSLTWTLPDQPATAEKDSATLLDAVTEANDEAALVRTNLTDGNMEIEHVTLAGGVVPPAKDDGEYNWTELTASLKRGDWVDFLQEDGTFLRYKLSWVSPLKKVYLFTNISSQKAVSISPEAMEVQLRDGTATLLQDAPLMDRAVENMLETLQQRGE